MIVWGGSMAASGTTNTGGVYVPASNSWTPTSVAGDVPSPRYGHAAVWAGSEMLIWGGLLSNTGGRYDPTRGTWLAISMLGSPTGRNVPTGVWTGSEMIVWGGSLGATPIGDPYVLASGGRYCAVLCATPGTLYRDDDGDGFGDPGQTHLSCATPPLGWAVNGGDCNDADPLTYPGAAEYCDALDNDCDGIVDEDAAGLDTDGDGVHNACDDCVTVPNPSQADNDQDGVGDICDLDDGLIYVFGGDKAHIAWQAETSWNAWNVHEGDLAVLRASGSYTQPVGSNALANKRCGLASAVADDPAAIPVGSVKFTLVTALTPFGETSLGTDSRGVTRVNSDPCP